MICAFASWLCIAISVATSNQDTPNSNQEYFAIQVVDKATGRGVPLITLTTVNNIRYITDSAGMVAFREPSMMNRQVFFYVSGHGYEFRKDGFGYRGLKLKTTAGGSGRIEVERKNIAERVYRITGQGIYHHSVLLGRDVPIKRPTLAGDVLGQDTVQTAVYGDRIYWFWGDTNRAGYPLGQFKTSGATSLLPKSGGLDPAVGIDLEYFVDDKNFSRQMTPVEGPGAVWLHGLMLLREASHPPKMIGHYARLETPAKRYEHGLVLFNDETQTFDKLVEFDADARLYPKGQAIYGEHDAGEYIYFATALPYIRVRASLNDICDSKQYEAFTPLVAGTRYDKRNSKIERDEDGAAVWGWKKNTDLIDSNRESALARYGLLEESDFRSRLLNKATGKWIRIHAGSVHWNRFRNRWIMIVGQTGARESHIGEVWYAEADRLEGPWVNAQKIVTHDKYTFYNPAHQHFFDQQNGRVIYFQGTYSTTYSAAKVATPRYDYNQIMYRLDLSKLNFAQNDDD